jgi:hypothetical protein
MQLDLTKINEALKKINNLSIGWGNQEFFGLPPGWVKVSDNKNSEYGEEGSGYSGERTIVFETPELPVNVQVTFFTDSYGEDQGKKLVQFVTGKEKTITVYEPI